MTIGVQEAVLIHESMIFCFLAGGAPGHYSLLNHLVHFGTASATEAVQNLKELGGVTDGSRRERRENGLCGEHELNGVADDQANTPFSAERFILSEANGGVKRSCSRHVLGGKVNDDLATHDGSGRVVGEVYCKRIQYDGGHGHSKLTPSDFFVGICDGLIPLTIALVNRCAQHPTSVYDKKAQPPYIFAASSLHRDELRLLVSLPFGNQLSVPLDQATGSD